MEDVCDVKYIDYGGYDTVPADSLRQIRTDFLTLPFQVPNIHSCVKIFCNVIFLYYRAIECYIDIT